MPKSILQIFFVLIYLFSLFIPGYTLWKNNPDLSKVISSGDASLITYFFLQASGLYAFVLIFLQIIVGAFIDFWRRIFGPQILFFHITQGLITYALILTHPTMFFLNSVYLGVQAPLLLLLPSFANSYETFLSFGKIGFLLLSVGVFAGYFRTKPFLQKHWRKFHILNYVGFWFIFVHSWNVGSDTHTSPFSWLYPFMAVLVVISIFYRRLYVPFFKKRSVSAPSVGGVIPTPESLADKQQYD